MDGPDHNKYCNYMCAMTLMTQPTYLEAFAHVSPYFYNPPLPNGFITRELVKGNIWNIFSEIILTLWHATVLSVRYDCRSPCLLDRRKLTFTRVASHWCQKYMTSIQDGCCAIKANEGFRVPVKTGLLSTKAWLRGPFEVMTTARPRTTPSEK